MKLYNKNYIPYSDRGMPGHRLVNVYQLLLAVKIKVKRLVVFRSCEERLAVHKLIPNAKMSRLLRNKNYWEDIPLVKILSIHNLLGTYRTTKSPKATLFATKW